MNKPADLVSYVEENADRFGLSLSFQSRMAVLDNLPILFAMAERVESALSPDADQAPEFKL